MPRTLETNKLLWETSWEMLFRARVPGLHCPVNINIYKSIIMGSKIFTKNHSQAHISGMDEKLNSLLSKGLVKVAVDMLYWQYWDIDNFPRLCSYLLQACIRSKDLRQGKRLHAYIIKTGFRPRSFLQNRLLDFYCRCQDFRNAWLLFDNMPSPDVFSWTALIVGFAKSEQMDCAKKLFDQMPQRDIVSWNSLLSGYVECGEPVKALVLFDEMLQSRIDPDHFTFTSILTACRDLGSLEHGKAVQGLVFKFGFVKELSVGNSLVSMYGKCNKTNDAQQVFDKMLYKNVLSWVSLLSAYVQCGDVDQARQIFDEIPWLNAVAWNAMISGYEKHGHQLDALNLFQKMRRAGMEPDVATLLSAISLCTKAVALEQGMQIHAHVIKAGFESSISVSNALISFYGTIGDTSAFNCVFQNTEKNSISWNAMIHALASNGYMEVAHNLFLKMNKQSLISWTAIITGYSQHGQSEQALRVFADVQKEGIEPDELIFSSILSACGNCATLGYGRQIHCCILKIGMDSYLLANNSLISMYSKCGSITEAQVMFKSMYERDKVSWNAVIAALAQNGHGKDTLIHFQKMVRNGMNPDHITFISVLSACSYSGLVEEGWHYFFSMRENYGLEPASEHYACMVHLLGCAGLFEDAQKLIEGMAFQPDACVWEALLGPCRTHRNMQLGKQVAERLIELESHSEATYILLSNIYASEGKWNEATKIREIMRDQGFGKTPGCSWIEVKHTIHIFVVGYP